MLHPLITECLIIDDKKSSRELIRNMLTAEFPTFNFEHEASNCQDAVKLNNELKPNLVFLDIDLGSETGFDFLKQTIHKEFKLIFISAFDHFAVQAFKVNAVDYILKPFDKQELLNAVHKAMNHPYYTDMKNTIKLLIEAINGESTRLSIPVQHGFEFFDTNDIIRLESDGNYTRIFLKNKTTLTISKTLKVYDELLSRKGFVRIHASHLINIRELKSYYKGAGGYVVMSDGSSIDVSKSKKDEFLIRLNFSNFEKLT